MDRRQILKTAVAASAIYLSRPWSCIAHDDGNDSDPWLKLSVQQYSFNRQLLSGELKIEDFPKLVVDGTGIKAVEYYNGHMEDKAGDEKFFKGLRKTCDDLGAVSTLILCRSKPAIDSPDPKIRQKAIEVYRPWLTATKILGGQYIRVDTRHPGDADEQKKNAVAGLTALCEVAKEFEVGILVENHGSHSGNGTWLADVMKQVNLDNCGTLPDFQNFDDYDPYQGVAEMMPFAKVLCAKSKSFDEDGNETNVDFRRMLKIAKDAGFRGYIGIEYEGDEMMPIDGVLATELLIKKTMKELDGQG